MAIRYILIRHLVLTVVLLIHHAGKTIPTTIIILPLKPDKAEPVKKQLLSPPPNEANFVMRKDINAKSYILTLSVKENSGKFEKESVDYMWRQKFLVKFTIPKLNAVQGLDQKMKYNHVLRSLGFGFVDNKWYANCISSFDLVLAVSGDVYLELLLFTADHWSHILRKPAIGAHRY
ncbi:hypothetical protein RJ641_014152 [Dillenia turbinata]|uniref:Uncharacterized protein n=1 Tax=Dillenia turbinata TaxID=194707 RepID=A0AAN8YZ35_9MAGN